MILRGMRRSEMLKMYIRLVVHLLTSALEMTHHFGLAVLLSLLHNWKTEKGPLYTFKMKAMRNFIVQAVKAWFVQDKMRVAESKWKCARYHCRARLSSNDLELSAIKQFTQEEKWERRYLHVFITSARRRRTIADSNCEKLKQIEKAYKKL